MVTSFISLIAPLGNVFNLEEIHPNSIPGSASFLKAEAAMVAVARPGDEREPRWTKRKESRKSSEKQRERGTSPPGNEGDQLTRKGSRGSDYEDYDAKKKKKEMGNAIRKSETENRAPDETKEEKKKGEGEKERETRRSEVYVSSAGSLANRSTVGAAGRRRQFRADRRRNHPRPCSPLLSGPSGPSSLSLRPWFGPLQLPPRTRHESDPTTDPEELT